MYMRVFTSPFISNTKCNYFSAISGGREANRGGTSKSPSNTFQANTYYTCGHHNTQLCILKEKGKCTCKEAKYYSQQAALIKAKGIASTSNSSIPHSASTKGTTSHLATTNQFADDPTTFQDQTPLQTFRVHNEECECPAKDRDTIIPDQSLHLEDFEPTPAEGTHVPQYHTSQSTRLKRSLIPTSRCSQ